VGLNNLMIEDKPLASTSCHLALVIMVLPTWKPTHKDHPQYIFSDNIERLKRKGISVFKKYKYKLFEPYPVRRWVHLFPSLDVRPVNASQDPASSVRAITNGRWKNDLISEVTR
jgi:hypothetical protein